MNLIKRLIKDEEGQGMVEYALIIALVAVLLIGGLTALEGGIDGVFTTITNAL
jgi:pilus assembly protein Flp/PilA